jgi:hypothetical protein
VWTRRKSAKRMRPWIATLAAYALALHVLLTGVAAGHAMPGGNEPATSLFVICHGDGSSDGQDFPDKQPLAQSPCMFCTLAKDVCDPAARPWHCDQPCNGDFERRAAKRRTRHRVSFAHGPISAWAPIKQFRLRLIRAN